MKFLALFLLSALPALGALQEKSVPYQEGSTELEGFHVYDDAIKGPRPAVLVVHQWTGLSDYEKRRSRMLAEMGYNVFALDIYGKGVRPQPPAAGQEAGKYKKDRELYRKRLLAGLEILKKDENTNAKQMAAIGYCFGGAGVLELARAGVDMAGVVSFHGALDATLPAKKGEVKPKVLVLHGAVDPFVPPAQVKAFEEEMAAAGADMKLVAYEGAVHSFTQKEAGDDPAKGAAYQEKADKESWQAMKDFFTLVFGKKTDAPRF